MRYFISTITDVVYEEDENHIELGYKQITAPLARKYGAGLELADLCIAGNLAAYERGEFPFFDLNAKSGLPCIMHAPYNELYPHAIEPEVMRVAERQYASAYGICTRFGLEKMVVHANFVSALYHPLWFVNRQVEFWKRFLDEHEGDTVICIENVMESEPALLTDIVTRVDDARLRLCLDIGHANLSKTAPEIWLEQEMPYLSHLHIHNNKGTAAAEFPAAADTHSALDDGVIDVEGILKTLRERKDDVTLTLESAAIERSMDWLAGKGFLNAGNGE